MLTKNRNTAYIALTLLCLGLLNTSCRNIDSGDNHQNKAGVSLTSSYYRDSLFRNPVKAKNALLEERLKAKDSFSYHRINTLISFSYYLNNQIDSAFLLNKVTINYLNREQRISQEQRFQELASRAYNDAGVFFQETNQRDSAIYYLEKAVNAISLANNKHELTPILINLADTYNQKGDFLSAISNYRKALAVNDSLNAQYYNPSIYYGMARIYTNLKNYPVADYCYRMVEEELSTGLLFDRYMFCNNRGNYYYQTKEYTKALPWFYRADSISMSLNHPAYRAIARANLGEVYLLKNEVDSARLYLNKAGEFFLLPGAHASMTFYYNGLQASLALLENNLPKAEKLLLAPYDLATIDPTYVYLHHKRMEELYARKGDHRKAYEYAKMVELYNDSLHNVTVQNNIAEIDSRYRKDTTLLRQNILLSERTSEVLQYRYSNLILIVVLILLVLLTAVTIIYFKKKKEQWYAKQLAINTGLRMANIRNRVSPHYIFNLLNVILPATKKYEEIATPIRLLVDSIQNSLLASEKIAIALEEELKTVNDYIRLRKSTNMSLPDIHINVSERINRQSLVPAMCIQIPTENAVKYAFAAMKADRKKLLTIQIEQEETNLTISIKDNGMGYTPERYANKEQGTGTGLKVLFSTIELLNTRNQQKMTLRIVNENQENPATTGTEVLLTIPKNYNFTLYERNI